METFNFILSWVCVLLSLAFLAMCILTMEWQLILCGADLAQPNKQMIILYVIAVLMAIVLLA